MSQEKPYQYSAEDIRRYKQGLMSNEEMHSMENASLDDPFLADAMEGFEQVSPAAMTRDMDNLKSRLAQKMRPGISVSMRPNQWWSMAAGVVLVLGSAIASWYIYQPTTAGRQISQTQETKVNEQTAPVIDTSAGPASPAEVEATGQKAPLATIPKTEKPKINSTSTPIQDSMAKDMAIANEESKSAEKAEVTLDRLNRSASEDAASYKRISRAAPSQAAPMTNSKKDSVSSARIYAEPAESWAAFEVYMRNALRKPATPVLHGNVVVSFSVNPENGKLFDFRIDKTLHPVYDKEAIRVLKEGPAWVVYNTEGVVKTSYTVVF